MSALQQNPSTINALLPNRFKFILKRAPNVQFWIQKILIPGFSINSTRQPTPFVEIPLSGEHISYDPLGISFQVDADLANYFEIYNWMKGLGKPDNFEQYKALVDEPPVLDSGVYSDIVLFIMDGQQTPKFEVVFHDAFPTSLGDMEFDATSETLDRVIVHAEFKYTSFDINRINIH